MIRGLTYTTDELFSGLFNAHAMAEENSNSSNSNVAHTLMIPIFIFSLKDIYDNKILIDGRSLTHTNGDMIIAVQTPSSSIPTSFYSDATQVRNYIIYYIIYIYIYIYIFC